MQSEEIVSQTTPCKIIEFADFGEKKIDQMEKWLIEQIFERYGEKDEITVNNPLIRLSTKFEALSDIAQCELYGVAKKAALGNRGKMSLYQEFWNFLEMQPSAWEDIEEFADKLLLKEKPYKQAIGGAY